MSSYRLAPSAGCSIGLRADTDPATPDSDMGRQTRDSEIRPEGPAANPSPTAAAAAGTGKDIQEMMAKATKAAAYIRLLLHAKASVSRRPGKRWNVYGGLYSNAL